MKKIQTDCIWGLWKLFRLTVLQRLSLLLIVLTNDVRYIYMVHVKQFLG